MPPNPLLQRPHAGFLSSLKSAGVAVCLMTGLVSVAQAQPVSVSSLAQAEARRRAIQVNKAADEIARGYQLIDERKVEEALAVFTATYDSLPNIPLAQEHRMAARNGYVAAGCLHAQALAAGGDLVGANKLLEQLSAPEVAPNNARVLALKKRLADPDRFPPALTPKHIANVEAVQALLLKANSFLEIGDPDKAISTYQEVLRIDPANSAARRGLERGEQDKQRYYKAAYDHQRSKMLGAVDKIWEDPVPLNALDVSSMFGADSTTRGSLQSGRESITKKLRTLVFPNVEFAGATLDEVAELLRVRSRDLDPQGKGVNFIINLPPEARGKPISLNLQNVPMEEILRYVGEMCGVTYKVDEHAVTFVSLSDRNSAMIARSFRVPPDFIQNAPAGDAAAPPADPFANQPPGGGGIIIRRMGAKEFLEGRGVAFPEGSSARFNASTSTLTVRNTVQNMDMVELLVEQATKSAPKLAVVQVRMIEVNQSNLDELGFDWLMGGVGANGNNVFLGGGSIGNGNAFNVGNYPFSSNYVSPAFTVTPAFGPPVVSFPALPISGALGGPVPPGAGLPPLGATPVFPTGGGPVTSGLRSGTFAVNSNSIDSLLRTGSPLGNQNVAPGVLSVAGVFTDPQFQTVLRGLSQKKGFDVNVSPSVTTKNGLKATVEVVREFIYPTEYEAPQVPQGQGGNIGGGGGGGANVATPTTPTAFEMRKTGVELEVEPVISDDGRSVELTLTPTLTEFEGFVNYGSPIFSPASLTVVAAQIPGFGIFLPLSQPEQLVTPNLILQPIFKSQKVTTAVKVWDGATIVLGGAKVQSRTMVDDRVPILGNLPFIGRFFQSSVTQTETKNIIIFVTVNVVDPSGQKVNRDTASVSR